VQLLLVLGAWCAVSFALAPTVGRLIAGRDAGAGEAMAGGLPDAFSRTRGDSLRR